MNDLDAELQRRLAAMEARAPAGGGPPVIRRGTARSRLAFSLGLAPIMVLLLMGTAVAAGAVVVADVAHGYEGIENPGQPLAGARMACMTPHEAGSFLAAHGYTDVVWQVESGGQEKGSTTTVLAATPPEHGYVVPGSVLDDGRLHMIVDQRAGSTGSGDCVGRPMP
jgi:hypothetical protein